MLYSDCIENLLQLENIIVTNIQYIEKEMHVHMRMEKRYPHIFFSISVNREMINIKKL